MNYQKNINIGNKTIRKYTAHRTRTFGIFDCCSGRTNGDIGHSDAELVMAVTEWIAMHDGKARFRRRRDNRGVVRLELTASIIGRLAP